MAMALSDYERRVLREIESELAMPGPGRRARAWASICRLRMRLLVSLVAVAIAVVVGVFVASPGALVAATAVGFVLGMLWGRPVLSTIRR
jgi:hypothetical protein